MTPRITLAVTRRVVRQLTRDHRTVAMILIVPNLLICLLWWMFDGNDMVFGRFGPPLLAVFPLVLMFVVTSVTMLRERTTGTLERLLSMPMSRLDLLLGYALAFGLVALVQASVTVTVALVFLDLQVAGAVWLLLVVAVLDAVLGSTLGLLGSAFARTEFQAVQLMPALILPQFLLCGLLVSRDTLPAVLGAISDVLPLSYAVEAMQRLTVESSPTGGFWGALTVVAGFVVAAVGLGALTLRRRTD